MRSARCATTSRSCLTSELSVQSERVLETAVTGSVATSVTLGAMSACLSKSMDESAEARTILTLAESFWRKNLLKRRELASADIPSLSPRSCWMQLSNWIGFMSPSFSPLSVTKVSSALRLQYA